MLQMFLFEINAVLLNFLFIKNKCITGSTKILSNTTVFNVFFFFEKQISIRMISRIM